MSPSREVSLTRSRKPITISQSKSTSMPRKDHTKERIERFAERRDWTVKKAGGGYVLRDDEGRPIARLKPRLDGEFEIQRWGRRGRWETKPRIPPVVLPLEEALAF